jgi:hypothetical protein
LNKEPVGNRVQESAREGESLDPRQRLDEYDFDVFDAKETEGKGQETRRKTDSGAIANDLFALE